MRLAVVSSPFKVSGKMMRGLALLLLCIAARSLMAQAPEVLPSTITTLVGPNALRSTGGAAPFNAFPQPCVLGSPYLAYDADGDGCPASLADTTNAVEDLRVDGMGNVYWVDDTGSSAIAVHKYNPITGLVTLYAGGANAKSCNADTYGNGCVASDNQGNVATDPAFTGTGFTAKMASRGIGIAPNNDLYIAGYNVDIIWRIAYQTHIMSLVAGTSKAATYIDSLTGCTSTTTPACVLATAGTMDAPRGVGVDPNNNIYVADTTEMVVREIFPSQYGVIIDTVGGLAQTPTTAGSASRPINTSGQAGYTNGPIATSLFSTDSDVQTDSFGNPYVLDYGNDSVRALYLGSGTLPNNPGPLTVGNWYTVVGNGTGSGTGPCAAGIAACLPNAATNITISARKIAFDKYNNLYIGDTGKDVVWFVDHVTGYMRIIAGTYGLITGGAGCGNGNAKIGRAHV